MTKNKSILFIVVGIAIAVVSPVLAPPLTSTTTVTITPNGADVAQLANGVMVCTTMYPSATIWNATPEAIGETPSCTITGSAGAEGTGRGTRHTGSIGLARWKKDRFVSVDAAAEGGSLTTIPIIFSGDRLEINARTARAGKIVVEILDPAGKRLSGWEPSRAWRGDGLHEQIAWGGGTQLAKLQGGPISLRFHLEDAQLFSFAFRKGEEGGAA